MTAIDTYRDWPMGGPQKLAKLPRATQAKPISKML